MAMATMGTMGTNLGAVGVPVLPLWKLMHRVIMCYCQGDLLINGRTKENGKGEQMALLGIGAWGP